MNYKRLKEKYESDGDKRFAVNMLNMIHEGKLNAENFSLKGLWEAMGSPNFNRDRNILDRAVTEAEFKEAVDSSTFPQITGALINKVIQEAYNLEYGVGDQLVTKISASQKDDVIVGFADDDVMQEVPELMPYQEGSVTEKYHKIRSRKWGRIVSLSEEMVRFDQTKQVVMRAKRVGEMAKAKHEEIIMTAITGYVTSGVYAAYRPKGTGQALYSATAADPYTVATLDNQGSNVLADQTDLDVATAAMAAYTDENGTLINVTPRILLTAMALMGVGRRITRSQQVIGASINTATVSVVPKTFDVYSQEMGIKHLYSPYIDKLKSATYWFYGDFKKQFIYTEVFPLATFQAKKGNDQEFERDVLFRFKARFMGGCGAVTNRYVFESTGGG